VVLRRQPSARTLRPCARPPRAPRISASPLLAGALAASSSLLALVAWVARQQAHAASSTSWQVLALLATAAGTAAAGAVAWQTLARVRTAQALSGLTNGEAPPAAGDWAFLAVAVLAQVAGVPASAWTGWAQHRLNRTWSRYEPVVAPLPQPQADLRRTYTFG
jgi:hypothetical protein